MKTRWQDEGQDKSVTSPLSLVISGFAPVQDVRQTLTPQLRLDKGETDLILIDLGRGQNRMGGSILAQTYAQLGQAVPDVDDAEDLKAFFAVIQGLNADGHLLAYHDRSDGGLLTTVLEMAFAGHCGLNLFLDGLADEGGVEVHRARPHAASAVDAGRWCQRRYFILRKAGQCRCCLNVIVFTLQKIMIQV